MVVKARGMRKARTTASAIIAATIAWAPGVALL
jgi:hypothetical protein